jgi:hypothetical protein
MKPEIESQTTTIEELRALLERVKQQQLGVGDLKLVERLIVLVINLQQKTIEMDLCAVSAKRLSKFPVRKG